MKVEHSSPVLKCELHRGTSFQRKQYRKEAKHNFTVEKSIKHCLSQAIKVNINCDESLILCTLVMM